MTAKAFFAQSAGLGLITLQSPPLNLLSLAMIEDLKEAVAGAERDGEMRALLLRADGPVFSAGADVKLFAGRSAAEMRPLIESFLDLGHRIEALAVPTVVAVHGTCIAGALELALFCDFIWAAAGTMMGLPEIRLGIVPLAGGIQRIALRAGIGRGRSIALGGELVPAERFAEWGVVDHVAAADELRDGAEDFARDLAKRPPLAAASAKRIARAYAEDELRSADREQADSPVGLFDTEDAQRGIAHFLEHGTTDVEFSGT
jgi:enoyl-CoA hydratase/carnithine racemase